MMDQEILMKAVTRTCPCVPNSCSFTIIAAESGVSVHLLHVLQFQELEYKTFQNLSFLLTILGTTEKRNKSWNHCSLLLDLVFVQLFLQMLGLCPSWVYLCYCWLKAVL